MTRGTLIAIDGVDAALLRAAAREAAAGAGGRTHAGVSYWDASGVFDELGVADEGDRRMSPRTLLVLYAADLAFRVRWEIAPALEHGRVVVAAPYVQTAVAFGRAVGLPAAWLSNLFQFAPRAAERQVIEPARGKDRALSGFLDVAWTRWADGAGISRARLSRETAAHLRPRRARRRTAPGSPR